MPIIPPSIEDINNAIEERVERFKQMLVRELCICGEKCVNYARNTALKGKDYQDQTGNLRSSTGYIVVADGAVVQISSFDSVKDGNNGARSGRDYALQLAEDFSDGIALIVVAGMKYAAYVANKGYDVLDTAEIQAERIIAQLIKDLEL